MFRRGDIARSARWFEQQGFRVRLGTSITARHGYLAGDDAARAEDFMGVWTDPGVDGIVCLRGGYGCERIVDRLDWAVIATHPKPFVGFSNVTALHAAFLARANLVTFYGAMASSFARSHPSPYTAASFLRALTSTDPLGHIPPSPDEPRVQTITPGVAEGLLVGGLLRVLVNQVGTPDDVDWRGCIVFFEEVDQEPWVVDANILALRRSGKLQGVAGIVVGEHTRCGPREYQPTFPSTLSLEEVFDELIRPLGIPTLYNLPLGHGAHHATVPLGVRARLDATAGTLEILEPAATR